MIDTHCHLTDPRLLSQLADVFARAGAAGVERLITIGCDLADDRAVIELCQRHPQLRCGIGVHPNYCHEAQPDDLKEIATLAQNPSVVALGEMGLDYFHKFAPVGRQRQFFESQLEMAQQLRMPVVIHSRDAIDDSLAVLNQFPDVPAVFHCFSSDWPAARKILDRGYFLGIDGPVTFKNGSGLREAVRQMPRNRVLIETDAPYLTPEPLRKQKVNEPALVSYVLATIAQLWGISLETADQITTANAKAFFRFA